MTRTTCIVAQAIARQIPNARRIEVDIQTIRWSDENGRHVFLTPYAAAGYVVAFDAGEDLHPFRFQLRDSVPSVQKRAVTTPRRRPAKKSRERKHNERRKLARRKPSWPIPRRRRNKVAQARERVSGGSDHDCRGRVGS